MMHRALSGFALVSCLGACRENHSALVPHGPVAQDIASLTWLLLAIAGMVMIIVGAALWIALAGPDHWRRLIGSHRAVIAGGAIFPVIVLGLLLFEGIRLTGALSSLEARNAISIEVTGEQWWWRVRYGAGAGRIVESANEVRIPVGQDIVFQLRSADVIHSFWIASLAGKVDMIPGRSTTLRLSAARPGVYRGMCAEYCGGPHTFMAFDVIAMPKAEYETWLQTAAAARPPSTDESRRGQALFMQAGCGGCHAIGGTAAAGTIGPSLTTLAERRSVAAGSLPMSQDNLARFIADGQKLKPGNRMPAFRIFSDTDLRALTAYLAGLK